MKKYTLRAAMTAVSMAAFAALFSAPAFAQSSTGMGTTGSAGSAAARENGAQPGSQISEQDRKFTKEAASGGMMEVELGRIASQNASSPDVKQFGQRMVDDHTKVNDRLKSIAAGKGIDLPQQMNPEHKNMLSQMSKLKGAEFDKAYMQHMVKDHEKDVAHFQHQAQSGSDADLREFAKDTTPTLKDHLAQAKAINSKAADASSRAE